MRTRGRGSAIILAANGRYSYAIVDGDPLGLGLELEHVTATDAYDALAARAYPDAIVQIAQLSSCARSGDIIVSPRRDGTFANSGSR